jgi:hypothetical protein
MEVKLDKKEETPQNKEHIRIMTLLISNRAKMAADYRNTIKKNGSLLTNSMSYAYSKGLEDAFKLIANNKEENEKPIQD